MKTYIFLVGFFLMSLCNAHAAGLFRWVDEAGDVHYSDEPPATKELMVERKKFYIGPDADRAELPYETRRALQNFPVTLYVASNCSDPCRHARVLLGQRGIPYTEKNLSTQDEINEFSKLSGSDLSPTLGIGKAYLRGFQAEQWNSELDFAGYPQTSLYQLPQSSVNPSTKR